MRGALHEDHKLLAQVNDLISATLERHHREKEAWALREQQLLQENVRLKHKLKTIVSLHQELLRLVGKSTLDAEGHAELTKEKDMESDHRSGKPQQSNPNPSEQAGESSSCSSSPALPLLGQMAPSEIPTQIPTCVNPCDAAEICIESDQIILDESPKSPEVFPSNSDPSEIRQKMSRPVLAAIQSTTSKNASTPKKPELLKKRPSALINNQSSCERYLGTTRAKHVHDMTRGFDCPQCKDVGNCHCLILNSAVLLNVSRST
jgi:hypothetical protein